MKSLCKVKAVRGRHDLLICVGPIAAGEFVDHSSIKEQTKPDNDCNDPNHLQAEANQPDELNHAGEYINAACELHRFRSFE